MKKLINLLFTASPLFIPNWGCWALLTCIAVWVIEGKSNNGFENESFYALAVGLLLIVISVIYNLRRESIADKIAAERDRKLKDYRSNTAPQNKPTEQTRGPWNKYKDMN